jgi:DNA modification methylase
MSATATPYLADVDATVWHGDVRDVLPQLEAESVDCALCSPPFYGLRDYGVDGQIGLEATPDEWAAELVAVFREVRRVLKPAGTLWVECGDSYASAMTSDRRMFQPTRDNDRSGGVARRSDPQIAGQCTAIGDLKPKDLLGQPWLLAFALRADGWYLRQCIVWAKPNAMPESVRDRCTTAHSYLFLLSKESRYFFDADAIAEPAEWAAWGAQTDLKRGQPGSENARGTGMGFDTYGRQRIKEMQNGHGSKNARSVWTIPTQGYPGAHFATWPEKLVERILLAGCPEGGVCLDPFAGSGTTLQVARRLGRRSVGVELNADYCRMIGERLQQLSLLA